MAEARTRLPPSLNMMAAIKEWEGWKEWRLTTEALNEGEAGVEVVSRELASKEGWEGASMRCAVDVSRQNRRSFGICRSQKSEQCRRFAALLSSGRVAGCRGTNQMNQMPQIPGLFGMEACILVLVHD